MNYYYLKDNRIWMSNEKMPTEDSNDYRYTLESQLEVWKDELQPCEISASELDKITWSVTEPLERIIDVTNIIEEIGCGCGCNESFIKFKQTSDSNEVMSFNSKDRDINIILIDEPSPKQVYGEIEDIDALLNTFGQFCTLNGIKLTDSNKVGQAVINFLKSDIYQIFKTKK